MHTHNHAHNHHYHKSSCITCLPKCFLNLFFMLPILLHPHLTEYINISVWHNLLRLHPAQAC